MWLMTDQSFLGWLLCSMTPFITCEVINLRSSREVWKDLDKLYGPTNRSKIIQLSMAFQVTRKNGKISDYLTIMKQLFESLALAREPISTISFLVY